MTAPKSDSPSEFTVHVSRMINAPRPRVFEAWVRPELVRTWWLNPTGQGPTACKIDARVGGRYEIREVGCIDEHGRHDPSYEWIMQGEFVAVVVPECLVFTWNVNHKPPLVNNRVTVEFRNVMGNTEVAITHERLPTPELRNGTYDGWTKLLDHLARRVSGER